MPVGLGFDLALITSGLVLVFLVWLVLRILPRGPAAAQTGVPALHFPETQQASDAVLIVQPGGRVGYINRMARQAFGLVEGEPAELERLGRRVRPLEDFLGVCTQPDQKRLSVNGKMMEATSYQVPGESPMVLVSLRLLELAPSLADSGESATSILKVVADFSQSIASSLDLQATLHAVLDNVSRLIPADALELKVWDEETQALAAYRFRGTVTGSHALMPITRSQFGPLTEKLVAGRQPLLLIESEIPPEEFSTPIRSYLGVPLVAGGKLVGTVEAAQLGSTPFGPQDLDLLKFISGQAAVAIRNATLYEEEERRAAELAGLARLSQAVSAIQEPRDLFARLVESIAPLFNVEILGFLLYDEDRHILEAQSPFRGLPEYIMTIYRAGVEPGSEAEKLIMAGTPVLTLDASQDENWRTLGLGNLAVAASLHDSALVPLVSTGRMAGYLQLSHHTGGSAPFSPEELRLMNIIGNQAGAIIENALLVRESRSRARRSDSLRYIASLSVSSATTDEMLKYSMQELARLFLADAGGIFLLDEERGCLTLQPASVWGVPDTAVASFSQLLVDEPAYLQTVSHSRKPFFSGRLSEDRRVLSIYRPLVTALTLESALVVPLVVRDHSIGELMLGSSHPDHFSPYDLQIVTTAAGQLAAALETAGLMGQTDASLRKRVEQLTGIARVSRELGASLDPRHLMEVIHDEALRVTGADCGAILLLKTDSEDSAVSIELAVGCPSDDRLSALDQGVLKARQPVYVDDFTAQGGHPPHEGVRSALSIPILQGEEVLGLINLHSRLPSFFENSARETLDVMASQAAVAILNARRFQDERQRAELLRRRAETLARLSGVSYALNQEQPLEQSLQTIAQAIHDATPFQTVLISLFEPETGLLRRVTGVGFTPEALAELFTHKQPLAGLQNLMKPEFRIGRSYFIPADKTPILPADVHYVYSTYENPQGGFADKAWDPDDFLLIPLEDSQGTLLGLISLDSPSNGLRPDRATVDSLELFAAQAALAISSSGRINGLQGRVEALTDGLRRQQKLLSVSQNDLPLLLHKDLEQTISLHNLERRAQRIRAGLAITESVSRQLDSTSALAALGRETLSQLGMSTALVAEEAQDGPRLLHTLGSIPRATNVDALFGQRNPLRVVLQSGEPILVANLEEDEDWRDTPLLSSLRAKGLICLPVIVEGRTVAAMLAVSPEPIPAFTDEDRQVYYQISRQTSVVLQNISLLSETRRRLQEVDLLLDFSRRLVGLDPEGIVKALLESARRVMHNAHAGVVFLYNSTADQLIPRAVSGYVDNASLMRIHYRNGEALPGSAFQSGKPRRVAEINFARDYTLNADNLLTYRQATGGRLPIASMLVPIMAGGQVLGLINLDNFNTGAAFKEEDEALLLALTQQVALSLENVRLVQAAQERAGQLEALNVSSASMTSSLKSEELVASLLDQLAPIVPYDTATLWLRNKDRLEVASALGFPDTERRLGLAIAVSDSALFNEMVATGRAMAVGDVREDSRFPRVEIPRLSWLGIPLISKGRLDGVIALEKWQAFFYNPDYVQLATTFASQAVVSLENARLYEDSLNRAGELDRRSQRLALLNRFSSELSGLLDPDQILGLTAEELLRALSVDRISTVVMEHGHAVWRTSTPAVSQTLPMELPDAPLFARLRESLGVFSSNDVVHDAELVRLESLLESTNSLWVLPLVSGQELRALIFAHMVDSGHIGMNEMELARTIAYQSAIALENARLYESTVRTAERLEILNEGGAEISTSLEPEQIYAAVHRATQRVVPAESFAIRLYDQASNEVESVYVMERGVRQPASRMSKVHGPISRVLDTGQPVLTGSREESSRLTGLRGAVPDAPVSILAVPMSLGGRVAGLLSVQSDHENAFSSEDMQFLGTLANQAIVSIQNGRLFAEIQGLAQGLEQRVIERTAQLQHEQQNTETLLRILTEVSSSLDLDRALNRTLSLLNDVTGAEQGTIMLLNPEDSLLHFRAGYGYLTERTEITNTRGFTLKVGEGLAGWVVQNREAVLADDLRQDPRWVQSASSGQEHRSSIVAPLLVGEDVIGVLMIFHRNLKYFSPDILNLVKAIAGQVAVAINNAHLYELIRDQAERLGIMLRKEQEDTSRSMAILEAVADGVLVTGVENDITFANASLTRILDVRPVNVIGKPVENFGALFSRHASGWMETVRKWSEDAGSVHQGEIYAEQLELENGRIALIHLSPVVFQNDFLGTVSIFRDITHEVEVDRLKSEFVATVSHELRTPLTSIQGYADLLIMGAAGAFNDKQLHFMEIVRNNASRLNILVNDLLDISRIEAGNITLTPLPLDLRNLAEDVIEDVLRRSREEAKPMAVSLDAPRELPRVLGDAERVRQIIANLVDNAYRYTPENGIIRVQISPVDGREVQVDVEDNGVGIALQEQDRIFERFYRGDDPMVLKTAGTGLGLPIVRQLVEMHHGRIWMSSKGVPGEGSTFSFTLPVQGTN